MLKDVIERMLKDVIECALTSMVRIRFIVETYVLYSRFRVYCVRCVCFDRGCGVLCSMAN